VSVVWCHWDRWTEPAQSWPPAIGRRFHPNGVPASSPPWLRSAVVSHPSPSAPDLPAAGPFRAPVGVHDVLPPTSARWEALIATFAGVAGRAGYGLCQSPMFEDLGVFARMGEGTDVVSKEMYEFRDRGDRQLALRPEGTASVVRAFIEHRPTTPWKVWYATPVFRYEKPQGGRYRQHHQLGVEAIGSPDPDLDAEVIVLLHDLFVALGLREVPLVLNTLGTPADRVTYAERVRTWLETRRGDLDPEDQAKVAAHPLRVLDSKRPATQAVVVDAPVLLEALDAGAVAHFERVQDGLRAAGVQFTVDPRLVRGIDYYTHTLFEFRSTALDSAQNTIGGGGRYDGLAEALGGPATPGVGFGAGIERILLACDAEGALVESEPAVAVFVVDTTGGEVARTLTLALRRAGIGADRAWDNRSMKAQMKAADRSGARLAAIVGSDEASAGTVTLRPLRSDGEQFTIDQAQLIDAVRSALA
jgi:histidyl-tRNA synthetase